MATKKEIKLINECWIELDHACESLSFNEGPYVLLEICKDEARRHDRMRPEGIERGMSLDVDARYFAILRLYQYSKRIFKEPKAIDYNFTQRSCFAAYCLRFNPRSAHCVLNWLTGHRALIETVASLDYSVIARKPGHKFNENEEFEAAQGSLTDDEMDKQEVR